MFKSQPLHCRVLVRASFTQSSMSCKLVGKQAHHVTHWSASNIHGPAASAEGRGIGDKHHSQGVWEGLLRVLLLYTETAQRLPASQRLGTAGGLQQKPQLSVASGEKTTRVSVTQPVRPISDVSCVTSQLTKRLLSCRAGH